MTFWNVVALLTPAAVIAVTFTAAWLITAREDRDRETEEEIRSESLRAKAP
jgi:hypothetical protein